jgi:hypothetical protein
MTPLPRGRTCTLFFFDFGGEKVRIGRGSDCNEANTHLLEPNYKKNEIEKSNRNTRFSPFVILFFFSHRFSRFTTFTSAQSQHVTNKNKEY